MTDAKATAANAESEDSSGSAKAGKDKAESAKGKTRDRDSKPPRDVVEVELEPSRQRQIIWTIGGILGGLVLINKLGTVGVWAGYALIAYGIYNLVRLVISFVHPPGKIIVTDKKVVLPRGLHRGKPIEVTPKDVTAVYFLRRSVPWNRASPVLVIELGEKAMPFPRDWFATEADQRHIVMALLGHLRPAEPVPAASAE